MDVKTIKELLRKYNVAPLKSLGQHFLINEAALKQIIHIAGIRRYDTIIEVGAGLGILTQELLRYAKKVFAVEIDKGFVDILKQKFANIPRIKIVHENILSYKENLVSPPAPRLRRAGRFARNKNLPCGQNLVSRFARNKNLPCGQNLVSRFARNKLKAISYKLIGNLPYNLTSQILEKFLRKEVLKPQLMVVMIQKEVAERITATPPNMNRLALLCQYYAKPKIMLAVPPHHFWPQPKVHSSLVKIEVKKQNDLPLKKVQEEKMWKITKQAFSQPRKKLRNSIGLSGGTFSDKRPEELGVEEWIELTKGVVKG